MLSAFHVRSLHDAFVGSHTGVGVGIVGLHAKPVEILHHIHLRTQVAGITEVHRLIIGVLPLVDQAILDRVLQPFVEEADHELLGGFREKLIAQVDVIGHGVLQVGITLLLVIFVEDAVGHDFEEAGAVDGPGVGEAQVGIGVRLPFGMEAGQPVGVALLTLRIHVAREFQHIALLCMLHT